MSPINNNKDARNQAISDTIREAKNIVSGAQEGTTRSLSLKYGINMRTLQRHLSANNIYNGAARIQRKNESVAAVELLMTN